MCQYKYKFFSRAKLKKEKKINKIKKLETNILQDLISDEEQNKTIRKKNI